MIPRLLTAFGVVAASVGFMFIGIGEAVAGDLDWMMELGILLMIAGAIAAVIGGVMYRSTERAAEALIEHQNRQRGNLPDPFKN